MTEVEGLCEGEGLKKGAGWEKVENKQEEDWKRGNKNTASLYSPGLRHLMNFWRGLSLGWVGA